MDHDTNCQSHHGKFLLFEHESKNLADILDGKVINEEADEPLEDPHPIGQRNSLDLLSELLAFYL